MRANLYLRLTSKVPEMDEGEERLSSIYEYSHMATHNEILLTNHGFSSHTKIII